jgi:heat shock protein HslJ
MECLRVKREASGPWELFYSNIEGFDYQPEYLYRIRVREEKLDPGQVPADGSSIKYTLVEITEKTPDPKLRLNDIWVLQQMEGRQIADSDLTERLQRPYIEFHLRDNRYMGTDGCNTFRGTLLSVGEEKLQLGPAMSTRMSCGDMELPNTFLRLLSRCDSYRIGNRELSLLEGNTILMTFQKTD